MVTWQQHKNLFISCFTVCLGLKPTYQATTEIFPTLYCNADNQLISKVVHICEFCNPADFSSQTIQSQSSTWLSCTTHNPVIRAFFYFPYVYSKRSSSQSYSTQTTKVLTQTSKQQCKIMFKSSALGAAKIQYNQQWFSSSPRDSLNQTVYVF